MSLGLIVNILFVAVAVYSFQRSLHMLHTLVKPDAPRTSWRERFQAFLYASHLMFWFSLGTLVMMIGLTGLLSRVLLQVL